MTVKTDSIVIQKLRQQRDFYQANKRKEPNEVLVISARIKPPLLELVNGALAEVSATELVTFALAAYFGVDLETLVK